MDTKQNSAQLRLDDIQQRRRERDDAIDNAAVTLEKARTWPAKKLNPIITSQVIEAGVLLLAEVQELEREKQRLQEENDSLRKVAEWVGTYERPDWVGIESRRLGLH